MIFRVVRPEERIILFQDGYKEWSKSRTFEQYCLDNGKEDEFGTRYALTNNGEIVSSTIVLTLGNVGASKAYGIGSVLTPLKQRGKGYGRDLMRKCIDLTGSSQSMIFLYSDISPLFYEALNFRRLPEHLQKNEKSICMVYCSDEIWNELIHGTKGNIPDYF